MPEGPTASCECSGVIGSVGVVLRDRRLQDVQRRMAARTRQGHCEDPDDDYHHDEDNEHSVVVITRTRIHSLINMPSRSPACEHAWSSYSAVHQQQPKGTAQHTQVSLH
jgi:hypothetical protein